MTLGFYFVEMSLIDWLEWNNWFSLEFDSLIKNVPGVYSNDGEINSAIMWLVAASDHYSTVDIYRYLPIFLCKQDVT